MKKKIIWISIICIFLDQLIKALLNYHLYLNQSISIIPSFFSISYVRNEGAAWSLFSGNQLFLIIVTFFSLFLLYFYFIKEKEINKLEAISYGLLFGGIFGNLIDRIFRGYVIDYLDFTIFNYHYPVFNFADICIVIGVMMIIFMVWKGEIQYDENNSQR